MLCSTHRVVIEHELDCVQLDQLADTAVAYGQVTQQLQRFGDDGLTAAPILQIGDSGNTDTWFYYVNTHTHDSILSMHIHDSVMSTHISRFYSVSTHT